MTIEETLAYNPIRAKIGSFLANPIIDNKYIYLSFWSIIHLLSGGIIFRASRIVLEKRIDRFVLTMGMLGLYEILEFWAYNNVSFFIAEPFMDVFWDLIIGGIGAGLVWGLEVWSERKVYKD